MHSLPKENAFGKFSFAVSFYLEPNLVKGWFILMKSREIIPISNTWMRNELYIFICKNILHRIHRCVFLFYCKNVFQEIFTTLCFP